MRSNFNCCEELCDSNGQPGLVLMISGNCCLQISDQGNLYEATPGCQLLSRDWSWAHHVRLQGSDWSPHVGVVGVVLQHETVLL